MRLTKAILLTLSVISGFSQERLEVIDHETKEPVSGAQVIVKSGEGEEFGVTDKNGQFGFTLNLPIKYLISHVSYQNLDGDLSTSGSVIELSPQATYLDDVVITGQYQPQSAKNAVYKVRSISSERIAAQNANSIHDVLSNELNIRISRDNATGRSNISLQGLSAQYVKVLVDGVPLVGKGGVSNDVDLGQIDIQQVERFEIVEGPMAVNYGADALAGVINIITKKDIEGKMDLKLNLQTETAGDEYKLFDQGIYSPSVNLGYKPAKNWYTQVSGRYYRFGGWQGRAEGREKEWHPKEQLFGGWLTRYSKGNWEVYYRLDVMDELITNLGPERNLDNKEPRATDEEYNALRFNHQVQSDLSLGKSSLNSVFSYTDYERLATNYERFLDSGQERRLANGNDTIYYRNFFTRNTLSNFLSTGKRSFQAGIESTHETSGGSTLSSGDKHLTNVAMFLSGEFVFNSLKVRPGIRYSYNSLFETIPTPSINFFYSLSEHTQFRWSYGRGFRAPSIRELFHEFIDSNHNILGNDELTPEDSHNFNFDVTHNLKNLPIELTLSGFYNEINDGIVLLTPEGNSATTYFNLTKNKTHGGNLRGSYKKGPLNASVGISHTGRYQFLRNEPDVPDFVYASEFLARAQYNFTSIATHLSAFYKYTGPLSRYQLIQDDPQLTKQDGYHTLDANASRSFGNIKLAIGVRNALDVTSINTSGGSGGAHSGGDGVPIGFGRSYFLSINYKINH